MRAALVSATSLLALLLLEGHEAVADPIINAAASIPVFYRLGSTGEAGTDSARPAIATSVYMFTPLTTGVGATTSGRTSSTPYFVIGQSALARLATSNPPAADRSDGDLPSLRSAPSSGGTAAAGGSVFVGTSESISLLDSAAGFRTGASASFGYNFSPAKGIPAASAVAPLADADNHTKPDGLPVTSEPDRVPIRSTSPDPAGDPPRVAATAMPTVSSTNSGNVSPARNPTPEIPNRTISALPAPSLARSPLPAARTDAGNNAGTLSAKPNTTATAGYTYTPLNHRTSASAVTTGFGDPSSSGINISQPVTGTPKGPGGRRIVSGSVPGASVFSPSNPKANAYAARASSSPRYDEAVKAVYLALQLVAGEASRGDANPADPANARHTNPGADASSFNISSRSDGSVVTPSATVPVPIVVVGTSNGELASSLTIFTAQSTAYDGEGDSFSYFLDRGVVH